jgi:HmuY protein
MKILYLILFLIIFVSCETEDSALDPPKPGDIETMQIAIEYPYLNQVYYDCGTNSVVSQNTKYDWDIGFESGENGSHIILNTAKGMYAKNLKNVELDFVHPDPKNINWDWDDSSGDLDSLAIKTSWENLGNIFIINRQYNSSFEHSGYVNMRILSVDDEKYEIEYFDYNNNETTKAEIIKDNSHNFVHFSFESGQINIEPNKNDWDILFTNYQNKFRELDYPFVITGALINRYNGVVSAEDSTGNFFDILLGDSSNYEFSNNADAIGYDWKIRNSDDNSFEIDERKFYIIRATEGIFYKLRFIDFYNNEGEKGFPKFELQRL